MKPWCGFRWCIATTFWLALLPNVVFCSESTLIHTELNGESGTFKSPNFPGEYPSDTEYLWEITVPEGNKVFLEFLSFEVSTYQKVFGNKLGNVESFLSSQLESESETNCEYDYVEVLEVVDSTVMNIGRMCGKLPVNITSSTNKLFVKFKSDDSEQFPGFEARYSIAEPCVVQLTEESGEISTPNYPLHYPSNKECTWVITVPEGKKVSLKFQSFDVSTFIAKLAKDEL